MRNIFNFTKNLSLLSIFVVNLYPAYGIMFNDWSIITLISFYWIEGLVFGFFALLKIITAKIDKDDKSYYSENQYKISMMSNKYGCLSFTIGKYSKFILSIYHIIFYYGIFFFFGFLIIYIKSFDYNVYTFQDAVRIYISSEYRILFIAILIFFINDLILYLYDFIYRKEYINACPEIIVSSGTVKIGFIFFTLTALWVAGIIYLLFFSQMDLGILIQSFIALIYICIKTYFDILAYKIEHIQPFKLQ